ncbi:sodium:solute symporter [Coraliomargarita sp. SDUM461004]|uniref:Sodium:solute symporter n=1 Tax=Thalassobacterium sedimentorum TaxID=3041258 RepID=A0ABU1AEI7_9BACT|nr:sodium:solute symporter [Coraliomargarita sp. SDUM461004]MDQ8192919.1 sodium:solute symporter [Coraliomargarita sp. SDUM461004]
METAKSFFNAPNIIIIFAYFAIMVMMGVYFSRKNSGTEDYFLGGKTLPSWAIGLSMVATSMSSITFLAMPAAAFALDWRMIVPSFASPIVALIAMWIFVPFFRKNAQVSAYEYLHKRYGNGVRLYSSIVFLIIQAVRMGAILYLLVIPLNLITGIDPLWIVLLTGGSATIYTLLGGMSATVWTDVIQSFVLYIGGFIAIAVMAYLVPGGLTSLIQTANEHGKFGLGAMEWDPSQRTFWTMLSIGIVGATGGFTTDQNVIQRYLSARSTRDARKATFLCATLSLPTWALFFLIGSCLFAFYQILPDPALNELPVDAVFPYFILNSLPPGVSGLVIAGILSAAMSTLSSGLNSFATVMVTDIWKPYLLKGKTDQFYTKLARGFTALAGILMFIVSYVLLRSEGESILDFNYKVAGLLSGVVVCFYLLGFFAPQVNRRIIWQSFTISFGLNVYLVLVELKLIPNFLHLHIHPYWVYPFVVVVMIVLSLALAYLQKSKPDKEEEER